MPFPTAAESSRQDANQHLSQTVVQGTLGTATPGTTLTMPLTGDPVTGAAYIKNISGFITAGFNTITATYPTGTTELYVYSSAAGTAGTLLVSYTDATKGSISTVVKTP